MSYISLTKVWVEKKSNIVDNRKNYVIPHPKRLATCVIIEFPNGEFVLLPLEWISRILCKLQ